MDQGSTLTFVSRDGQGKEFVRKLRAKGFIPGTIYGPLLEECLNVAVNLREFDKYVHAHAHEAPIFMANVEVNGKTEQRQVALREIQYHPVTDVPLHFDLYQFDQKRKFTLSVPVVLEGRPVGVEMGGLLQFVARDLRVNTLPAKFPKQVKIDVSKLNVGQSVTVGKVRESFDYDIAEEDGKVIAHVIALRKKTRKEEEEAAKEA